MSNPLFNKLSMARRAGQLDCGFDRVKDAVASGQSSLVLTASDLSPKTQKELCYFCSDRVTVLPTLHTMEAFGEGIGFRTGVVSVRDPGFAAAIRKILITEV